MESPPRVASSEKEEAAITRHYRELIEKSRVARNDGDHWAAQQFATAAHKWAMEEQTRLQRLAHVRKALTDAKRRLESNWDKDRECATVTELYERHPEFRSTISAHEKAEQLVRELNKSQSDGVTSR